MKSYFKYTLLTTVLIIVLLLVNNTKSKSNNLLNNLTDNVTTQQLQSQINLFKTALDELDKSSPLKVANIWAKGEKTRNGVFQYSVSCEELKSEIINKLGKPEENLWVIGVSSPWVTKYKIEDTNKINEYVYKIKIKYYWATSAGPSEPTYDNLTVVKTNNLWCVKQVK